MAKLVNFSVVFKKSTESLKKNFVPMIVLASVFGVVMGLLDYGKNSILFPGGMTAYGSPEVVASAWVSAVVVVVVNLLALLRTVAFIKMGTDTVLQKTPSATEAIEYSIKNFISFLWTLIVGAIYALRWALIGFILIPLYAILVVFLPKLIEGSGLNTSGIGFMTAIISVVAIIYGIYCGLKIGFMGYIFVQDGKKGLDAAKSSMAIVEGRWWDVFFAFFVIGIIMFLVSFVVMLILGLVIAPFSLLVPKIISTLIASVVSSILTLFGVVLGCNLYNEYKHMGNVSQTHE